MIYCIPAKLKPARYGSKAYRLRTWYRDEKSETHTTRGGRGHVGRLLVARKPRRKR